MDTLQTILLALGGGTTFVSIFVYGVQRITDRFLQSHFDKSIEHYKTELGIWADASTEKLKSRLQLESNTALEQSKSQLIAQNDQLRHELNKQIIRAQLATTSTHKELLGIAKSIRIAQGRYLRLVGLNREQTYEGYSRADIRKVLVDAKAPQIEARAIAKLFPDQHKEGAKRLREILWRKRIHDAYDACNKATNKIVLNRMLLGQALYKKAMGTTGSIHGAIVDVELSEPGIMMPEAASKRLDDRDKIDKEIESLEDAMSAKILPVEGGQADPAPVDTTKSASSITE